MIEPLIVSGPKPHALGEIILITCSGECGASTCTDAKGNSFTTGCAGHPARVMAVSTREAYLKQKGHGSAYKYCYEVSVD